jgi:hypothetical protein
MPGEPAGRVASVRGTVQVLPNPCTTRPCLPGMALALEATTGTWYLVRNRAFVDDLGVLGGSKEVGQQVTVTGRTAQRHDVDGEVFRTIELDQIE